MAIYIMHIIIVEEIFAQGIDTTSRIKGMLSELRFYLKKYMLL